MATPQAVDPLGSLGGQAFLLLLTTQLQHQDPLAPMDSTQFVTQLAQFSQLEQTTAMGDALKTSNQYMASLNNYGAAALIGKQVQVIGNQVALVQGNSPILSYNLGSAAAGVTVTITNGAGQGVRTLQLGTQSAGTQGVRWDGRDNQGRTLPDGNYSFGVSAVGADGKPVTANPYSSGTVAGVTFDQGVAYLIVNGATIPAANIVGISN